MATSLEELLAEEGFKGRRSSRRSRSSFGSDRVTTPLYQQPKALSASGSTVKSDKINSGASRYSFKEKQSDNDGSRNRRSREGLTRRERASRELGIGMRQVSEGKSGLDVQESKRLDDNTSDDEIAEDGVRRSETIKDIYFNKMLTSTWKEAYPKGHDSLEKEMLDEEPTGSSKKHFGGRTSSIRNGRKSTKKKVEERSNRLSFVIKSSEDGQNKMYDKTSLVDAVPALDEVAIQATISILTSYIKCFFQDADFRGALRCSCFSSLKLADPEESDNTQSKVMSNLEEAIETIEKAAEEAASTKGLKKASVQLSVIAGLNSNEKKDGFTCGIPNYQLSSCAHLYLSVIYKLQKKDRVSAKHLLQVFCNSPFLARTTLFPELWESFFYPHLSHLSQWYNQEAGCLVGSPSKTRRLKLLDKVYNEILDTGTYQFAVYYKDWLTEGFKAPSVPSINIPSISVEGIDLDSSATHSLELINPVGCFPPQPMVSKKLYEAVFGQSGEPGGANVEDTEAGNYCRSPDGSIEEVRRTLIYASETVKHMDQSSIEYSMKTSREEALLPEDGLMLTVQRGRGLLEASGLSERDCKEADSSFSKWQPISDLDIQIMHSSGTEFTTKFPFEDLSHHDSNCTIPKDFVCPLTGKLLEDPVTLETGYTFEKVAIRKWFDQGNRTCPMTGKNLQWLIIPNTNNIIKRVIDCWKSEYCKNLLPLASQTLEIEGVHESEHSADEAISTLEQLLTALGKEERIANANHLISLGGVQYLIRRFEFGALEEKIRVAELLLYCIEADADCRNLIAEDINRQVLFELLQCKQSHARGRAIFLLAEFICMQEKKEVLKFLSGVCNEEMMNMMHILLLYLRSPECLDKPLVAVLLLHFDLSAEPRKYSIYREEAVDAISVALDLSLEDENIREQCCRALLILGGRFSFSRKLPTESWILQKAGFNDRIEESPNDDGRDSCLIDEDVTFENDKLAHEDALRYLLVSLLGSRTRSFLEEISKCLSAKNLTLVRVCLVTVAWMSYALSLLFDAEFQLSAFSALVGQLKNNLESSEQKHQILASFSLLNFCKIPECRVLLMTIAKDIASPLRSIADVTWTAKQLYGMIMGEDL